MRSIVYLGHNCFLVRLGQIVLLFNPVVSDFIGGNRRLEKSALQVHSIRECDLIFVSNEEEDNCEPQTIKEISERCYSYVIAPRPALSKLDISDRFKVDVKVGDKFSLKGIDIEVVKAVHPQSQYSVGFMVRGEGIGIYYAGDTYSFTDMGRLRCDVAIVPIGGGATMDPFAANSIIKEIRPKVAIPMRYNTYEKIKQDVLEFTSDLGGLTKGVALRIGQELRL
ncbi:MAG: MBL fold metallo-hydrolase [Candidatus Micrarchaeota archaeon]|nr:MBL fold metallo-hydrolase [Candidatus Micrarchaeota archaeon]